MARLSSPAHNPFSTASAADGVEPYVSPPSLRGVDYSVPGGYRHHVERSWLVPSRPVLLGLLCVAGLMFYLRSDRILPVLMGTTTTRLPVPDRAASAVNPWTGEAHWGRTPKQAEAFPLEFPANLPATAAGPATGSGSGVVKCVQADGMVVYQQRDCGPAASAIRSASGSR
ncbi:hypothetical protein HZU83_21985 [Sphaerotilus montanus]|jgi:hypothetical protein|uniref:Uncharacterized protein n=1 Tax=Sphaerotilus montanus TaxID=522889 RepID=A0A7Y9UBI8_9BURK|nr:hypothetical protein [Sphaerotilus montanus]NYG32579.1 hypothetical protein [Sphaerotilus montanus]NZD59352.1 hypothetical protein [Sphaerotilus montanus]